MRKQGLYMGLKSLIWMLCVLVCSAGSAQLRIIPQHQIDSLNRPNTIQSGVRFLEQTIDLGRAIPEAGGVVEYRLTWQNFAENQPVVITQVKSSCNCLWADYGTEPLKRGAQGEFRVRYNPKGHPGEVQQRLFVYTNLSTSQPTAVVTVRGRVIPSADRSGLYPVVCGELLLRQREVTLISTETQGVIACLNGGTRSLTLREDRFLSPRGITIRTEPEVLKPGMEGDLVIRLEEPLSAPDTLTLYFEGLLLPPRQRTLTLYLR